MYEVRRLKKTDVRLANAICESLKSAYDPYVSRFFVHQDEGYIRFFQSILDHPAYATYYVYDQLSDELSGFACFQFLEGIIFLKHIVVDNRMRGSRIGTKLLTDAMADIKQTLPKGDYLFQLHVFERNSRALSWYLSIGMEPLDCTYWYDLRSLTDINSPLNGMNKQLFSTQRDNFGFEQIYYNENYIGTILARRTLIVKNEDMLSQHPVLCAALRHFKLSFIGYISSEPLQYELVDTALLMSKPADLLVLA
ncbi:MULTISPECIES: GNAT family N-acetyltransferase [Olivibacter]|jgi:ribosomal protein S18 acetylase RimI-like enzyme|uniref:GNAT family N-acetyltransferase n=1 Tax=Olivibacter oleidegradans TaxID=760123 RepID=A0ABV6HGT0_9SPHI|nr:MULTISPECIES: GNAT family N-acetyltransferase [Olivibacter]MDM8176745.1 GNAT family N-acetyltransferase [Olivibacter sp. 47]QEL00563.1 GNAT family N-acetyltransferase [Olivibacter sp. LS-1]